MLVDLRRSDPRVLYAALAALLGLLFVVIVREAWVSDDAYITFRTVDNFLHGYGLRWNVAERVQSYTHPLWLFLLVPVVWITGNPYLSSLGISVVCTAAAVGLVLAGARARPWPAVAAVTAMVLSKAFTEYSTSGLENALSHALLAALMLVTSRPVSERSRAVITGTIVAALGLTRLDLLLLATPIALTALRRPRFTVFPFLVGAAPLAAWEAFSLVYYGVPFPNTAYAKLGAGIPASEMWTQGVVYVLDFLNRDPITMFTILVGVLVAFALRLGVAPAMAILIYLVYVMRIGGDFMAGRFFTAPFVVSLCLIAQWEVRLTVAGRLAFLGTLTALGLSVPVPTVASDGTFSEPPNLERINGIADERGFYFQATGFLTTTGVHSGPRRTGRLVGFTEPEREASASSRVFVSGILGMSGYYTGAAGHIIDPLALCDPLLARLPARRPWRVGHYRRSLPAGYVASVVEDANRIEDPGIAALYDVIREVTRGPIWSARRWRAIVALNTGNVAGWAK